MKKNGFTLIELLAVIVILAVIALIVSPVVTNIISSSKDSANMRSLEGHIDDVNNQIMRKIVNLNNDINSYDGTFNKLNLELSSNDKIKCDLYVIEKGIVKEASDCKDDSWNKYYCYSKETGASNCSKSSLLKGNDPELNNGLIPIKYINNKAYVADQSERWYDYSKHEWANAILVKQDSRDKYVRGYEVKEDDVLAYFVWIPRYEYNINNTGTLSNPSAININFIGLDQNNTINYTTHPAFNFGGQKLTGIWFGKFQTTGEIIQPTIKPNKKSLAWISVKTMFTTSLLFSGGTFNNGDVSFTSSEYYGVKNADSHLAKNTEWGAAAYLSQSIYGRCTNLNTCSKMYINNNKNLITGLAGDEVDSAETEDIINQYNTDKGVHASTTDNIYGVYDMSGGAWDYTFTTQEKDGVLSINTSDFTQAELVNLNSKYYDKYAFGNDKTDYSRGITGDAILETKGYYNANISFIFGQYSFDLRGGNYKYGNTAGPFASSCNNGAGYFDVGFRSVLLNKE